MKPWQCFVKPFQRIRFWIVDGMAPSVGVVFGRFELFLNRGHTWIAIFCQIVSEPIMHVLVFFKTYSCMYHGLKLSS
jgi:hypothetical protein